MRNFEKFDYQTVELAKTKLPEVLKRNEKRLGSKVNRLSSKLELGGLDDALGDILEDIENNPDLQLILKGFLQELASEIKMSKFVRKLFNFALDLIFPASYTTYKSHSVFDKIRKIDEVVN